MPRDHRAFSPDDLTTSQFYDIMSAAIQPRPIAFVSSISAQGHPNLAPFSFFMPGGLNPASLAFSPTLNMRGEEKDTLRNIEATGEFTVSIVDRTMALGMNETAYGYPNDYDEWPVSGFTPGDSQLVQPKRVLESAVSFECKLFQVVRHGHGPSSACYVIGEILLAHVRDDLWTESGIISSKLRPIGRLGGKEYIDLAEPEIFELARPTAPSQPSS